LSDKIKDNETDESSDNYARQQKYILGFGFSPGGGGWSQNEEDHREHPIRCMIQYNINTDIDIF